MKTLLAVDVAASSGWCIRQDGRYVDSGQCDAFGDGPLEVVRRVIGMDRKAVMVLEKPSHGNRATLVGLGAAKGPWISAWKNATGLRTLARVKERFPATWRAKLWGDTLKNPLREKIAAQVMTGKRDPGPDESAACCLCLAFERDETTKKREKPCNL